MGGGGGGGGVCTCPGDSSAECIFLATIACRGLEGDGEGRLTMIMSNFVPHCLWPIVPERPHCVQVYLKTSELRESIPPLGMHLAQIKMSHCRPN